MQKCFTHIVNHRVALNKVFANGELTNKVLTFLDRAWQPKVTTIMESKDLYSMSLAILFGKLQKHEMKLCHFTQHEESDKRKKGFSFKAMTLKIQEETPYNDDFDLSKIDDETMTLLVNEFNKFLKKKEHS
ncbi:hypothetical protein Lal_00041082 [Lupinus albus]|nr:hypothetical protein Lal_00041082 [Lupinus albus]